MTWRSRESGDYLSLDSHRPFELEFDYLYFMGYSDNSWLDFDYLLPDRWTNMGATAATDPVGHRFRVRVISATEVEYRIIHKADGNWTSVPGSEGIAETDGDLIVSGNHVPGRPVHVRFRVHGIEPLRRELCCGT